MEPPAGDLIALVLLLCTLAVGSLARFPAPRPNLRRLAPKPWAASLRIFGLTTLFFALAIILPAARVPAPISLLVSAGLVAVGLWQVRSWSARQGWSERHALAIVMGILAYFLLVWGPLIEFALRLPLRQGLTLANAVGFLCLALFAGRLTRRVSATQLPSFTSL